MGFLAVLDAIVKLGLPMMIMSWLAFKWLYDKGEIDRSASHKELKSRVRNIKKISQKTDNKPARFLLKKWTKFGSGFYGLTGLWTFIVIEAAELADMLGGEGFSNGIDVELVSFIISFLVNQLINFITALLWFSYWPGPSESILVWVIVAFLGYRVGIEIARGRLRLPKFNG